MQKQNFTKLPNVIHVYSGPAVRFFTNLSTWTVSCVHWGVVLFQRYALVARCACKWLTYLKSHRTFRFFVVQMVWLTLFEETSSLSGSDYNKCIIRMRRLQTFRSDSLVLRRQHSQWMFDKLQKHVKSQSASDASAQKWRFFCRGRHQNWPRDTSASTRGASG